MAASKPRFAFVLSTSGSVMQRVLETRTVRLATHLVVSETEGPMLSRVRSLGIPAVVIDAPTNEAFCAELLERVRDFEIDYVLSFYTKFYTAAIRSALQDRIINFHPSLLPAFKGMDGFGDGLAYHGKIIGTTVELIKDVMDEGKIVMQTACAVDPRIPRDEMRHRIFVQQCKSLVQVVDWISHDRVRVEGDRVWIRDAEFSGPDFSPSLESAEALALEASPPPASLHRASA